MKRLVNLIQRSRRFRYTLTLLLIFGALFAVSQTRSQDAESTPKTETNPKLEGEALLPDEAKQSQPEVLVQPETEEILSEVELKNKAQKFLDGLSEKVSSKSVAEATKLPNEVLELAYQEKDKEDGEESLRDQLSNPETAGEYIHDLRMRGFVPVKSIRWIKPLSDKALESDTDEGAEEARAVQQARFLRPLPLPAGLP